MKNRLRGNSEFIGTRTEMASIPGAVSTYLSNHPFRVNPIEYTVADSISGTKGARVTIPAMQAARRVVLVDTFQADSNSRFSVDIDFENRLRPVVGG